MTSTKTKTSNEDRKPPIPKYMIGDIVQLTPENNWYVGTLISMRYGELSNGTGWGYTFSDPTLRLVFSERDIARTLYRGNVEY